MACPPVAGLGFPENLAPTLLSGPDPAAIGSTGGCTTGLRWANDRRHKNHTHCRLIDFHTACLSFGYISSYHLVSAKVMPAKKKNNGNIPKAEMERRKQQSQRDKAAAKKPQAKMTAKQSRQAVAVAREKVYNADIVMKRLKQAGYNDRMRVADMLAYPFSFQERLATELPTSATSLMKWRDLDDLAVPMSDPNGYNMAVALIGLPSLMWAKVDEVNTRKDVYRYYFENSVDATSNVFTNDAWRVAISEEVGWTSGTDEVSLVSRPIAVSPVYNHAYVIDDPFHGYSAPILVDDKNDGWVYLEGNGQLILELTITVKFNAALDCSTTKPDYLFAANVIVEKYEHEQENRVMGSDGNIIWASGNQSFLAGTTYTQKNVYCYRPNVGWGDQQILGTAGWYRFSFAKFHFRVTNADASALFTAKTNWVNALPELTDTSCRLLSTVDSAYAGTQGLTQNAFGPTDTAAWKARVDEFDDLYQKGPAVATFLKPSDQNARKGWRLFGANALSMPTGGDAVAGRMVRVNAASILLTNVAPEAVRGGTILACRITQGENDSAEEPLFYNVSTRQMLNVRAKQTLNTATGAFTFVLPTPSRNQMYKVIESNTSFGNLLPARVFYKTPFYICAFQPGQALLDGNKIINPMRITLDYVLEFISNSQRYTTGLPHVSWQELNDAICRILEASNGEHWYENPTHVAQLMGFLRSAMRTASGTARKLLPAIEGGLAAMYPAHAPAIRMGANALRNTRWYQGA